MELPLSRYIVPFAAITVGIAAQEHVQVVDTTFPGSFEGKDGGLVARLVDDLSGEPIVGAEVFLVSERRTPIAGEFWFDAKNTSDVDGFVRIPRPATPRGWDLVVMKHATRGTVATTYAPPVWRIGRTFAVPVRVLDWLGRPAPGALVGFCGGCGHTPDIVNAVADAQGIAVLHGIDPHQDIADVYVQHPGLHFFYDSVRWFPGEGPMEVRCAYGPVQTGRVVDHRGEPVAGAFVCGGGGCHRGPWAKTGADGTFTVLGGVADDSPHKVVLANGREVHFSVAARYPVQLQLPDLADANAHHGTTDRPRGDDAPAPVPTRTIRVVVEGGPENVTTWARFPGHDREAKAAAGELIVPVDAPFVVEVRDDDEHGDERSYAFADPKAVTDRVVVPWIPDARVVGRAVDPKGEPIAVRVRVDDEDDIVFADGRFDVPVPHEGPAVLEVVPEREGLRPRRTWVAVPPRGAAARVDVGDVVCGATPSLRVLDANDRPLVDAAVGFVRAGWQEVGQSRASAVADDGVWTGPDPREGDVVVVERDGHVDFRTALTGAGPWIVRQPDGVVKVAVVDPAGAPLRAVLTFGGEEVPVPESGVATLRGLPFGPLHIFVGSEAHRSAIVDVTVTSSPADIRVVLPKRR